MDVLKAQDQLLEDILSSLLLELPPHPDISKEVPSSTDFHHKDDMLLSLETLIEPHDIWVLHPDQHVILLHHLFLARFFVHEFLVYALQSNVLLTQFVDSEVNFTEGSFT
jgi:hypothetical protein